MITHIVFVQKEFEIQKTHHHKNRNQILRLGLRQSSQILKPIIPQQTRRPTLDKCNLGHLQQIGARASLESVAHMIQDGSHHAPVHALAEFDDAGGEAVALLRQCLDCTAGDFVALGYC
jgi:hypothetical protein